MDADDPTLDDVLITRAGPFVGVVQTFHGESSVGITLDLWEAEDDEDAEPEPPD